MSNKKITVEENGKKIYEGSDRRSLLFEKTFMGMFTPRDFFAGGIYVLSVVITITIMYTQMSNQMKQMNEAIVSVASAVEHNESCLSNSDNFHGAMLGRQFKCGQPIPEGYRSSEWRSITTMESSHSNGG